MFVWHVSGRASTILIVTKTLVGIGQSGLDVE